MPKSQQPQVKEASRPDGGDLLEPFLLSVENFVGQISALAAKAAPQGEHQVLIQSTGESLIGQTGRLLAFTRETASRLSAPQRVELSRFLRVQDGEAIASRAVEAAQQQLREGVVGRLVHWIAQHLKELKKILLEILHIVFDLLHIPWPDWLDRIVQIMDELLDLVLSLLADVFGIDFGRTARELSEQEVNFLREMAALESMKAARSGRRLSAQDEA
jgi:hypothetical protein